MMAQDVRGEIAAEALEALGTIRSPDAARALQTLTPASAPELRSLAERSLRRLRFIGIEVSPLPTPEPDWRSLVSPVDGVGHRSIWFIQRIPMTRYSRFLNVLLSDRAGAVEAVGHAEVPPTLLPPRQATGYLHDITLPDGSGATLMLEASFDLGRRLVLEALENNRGTQIPVAGSLRLLSPWLWGYAGAGSLPPRVLPELSASDEALAAVSDRLLAHPAFAAWTARGEMTLAAAEEAARRPGWDLEVWVKRLARELFTGSAVAEVLSQRLVATSEWLLLAGEEKWARLALATAQAFQSQPPHEQPFVKALIRRDLQLVMSSRDQKNGLALDREQSL
jgi:hypothetical protein